MNINAGNRQQLVFNGYDVMPLKGIYVQGLVSPAELQIFKEMKSISAKEGFDLFVNHNNHSITTKQNTKIQKDNKLSIWAQDNKAFIKNKIGKVLLWNSKEPVFNNIAPFNDYKIDAGRYIPRGGNYYLGYKPGGEKWLLINSMSITDEKSFETFGDTPTKKHLCELFDVKPENIYVINEFTSDLDEYVRPIRFPYILVNDYSASLKNIEKMRDKFIDSAETYEKLKSYITSQMKNENENPFCESCDERCQKLKQFGFKPIKIAGKYADDINFMNALAFENSNGKLLYITNSTKHSTPDLEYLETLFEKDLRGHIENIADIYFVSGGKREEAQEFFSRGFAKGNVIMDVLANRLGGIHCMCSEIPNFDIFTTSSSK